MHKVEEDLHGEGLHGKKGGRNVTQTQFEDNLKTVGFFDTDILKVTKGWYSETCKKSPVQKISFLKLDGDVFENAWDSITAFYDKVVPGGKISMNSLYF